MQRSPADVPAQAPASGPFGLWGRATPAAHSRVLHPAGGEWLRRAGGSAAQADRRQHVTVWPQTEMHELRQGVLKELEAAAGPDRAPDVRPGPPA